MTKEQIEQEVYRYPSDDVWGAPEATRQKAVSLLQHLSPAALASIGDEEVRPTMNFCMDIALTSGTTEIMVVLGDLESCIVVYDEKLGFIKDDLIPTTNFSWEMPYLADRLNKIVERFFV